MSERPQYSVVIPVYDEEPNLRALTERLAATFARMGVEAWELLWVDNGSSDGTLAVLEELRAADARHKYLSLSRNFGHAGAVAAGLDFASGMRVVLMDGDQQDPPEMIADFAAKMDAEGLDVVYGQRRKRERESLLRRVAMRIFYKVWRRTAYIHVPLHAGNFCLMTRQVVDALAAMRERGRFVPGMRAYVGFKQGGIKFDRPGRGAGEAKTTFWSLSGIAIDGLLAFSVFPLRVLMICGLFALFTSVVMAALVVLATWLGWLRMEAAISMNMALLVLVGGATLFGIGVIGEYVGRIYQEVKRRPIYVVRGKKL